jgi:GntR family transcriptional regulator
MKIDLHSSVPIYQQIAEGLQAEIAVGVYRPGEGLPSIRNLAVKLKVNQNTVHKAYGELESAGLIVQRRGLGMFVTNRAAATAKSAARRSALAALRRAHAQCRAAGVTQEDVIPLVTKSLPADSSKQASS